MKSEQINELAAALSAAQAEIGTALKTKSNPFYKSKYADLAAVLEAAKEPLQKNGLSVVQAVEPRDGKTVLVSTLLHKSGQWIESVYPINPVKDDPQGLGSAITYGRRYAYAALVGVASEDDDGERATHPNGAKVPPVEKSYEAPVPTTPVKEVLIAEVKVKDVKKATIKNKAGGKFDKWGIGGSDGNTYGTTKVAFVDLAHEAAEYDALLRITYEKNGKFLEIKDAAIVSANPAK